MKKAICLDLSYQYLQEIRLAHALSEVGYELQIPEEERVKFQKLEELFLVKFPIKQEDTVCISAIEIRHKGTEPSTGIGNLKRPLVFPHAMLDYCRKLWPERRSYDFCFLGLVTEARKHWLQRYLTRHVPGFWKILRKLKMQVAGTNVLHKLGLSPFKILITATTRGRYFPGKSWDDEYYRYMTNATYVLCPSGDAGCPWTYRFFEAMLCGAIPVVETPTPVYEHFYYLTGQDPLPNEQILHEQAEANFAKCRKLLTLPHEQLARELDHLVQCTKKQEV